MLPSIKKILENERTYSNDIVIYPEGEIYVLYERSAFRLNSLYHEHTGNDLRPFTRNTRIIPRTSVLINVLSGKVRDLLSNLVEIARTEDMIVYRGFPIDEWKFVQWRKLANVDTCESCRTAYFDLLSRELPSAQPITKTEQMLLAYNPDAPGIVPDDWRAYILELKRELRVDLAAREKNKLDILSAKE